jgi:hypothetical protein
MTADYAWDCPHCTHHEDSPTLALAELTYGHHLWVVHAIRGAEQPIPLEDVIPMTPDQVAWVRRSRGAPIDGKP